MARSKNVGTQKSKKNSSEKNAVSKKLDLQNKIVQKEIVGPKKKSGIKRILKELKFENLGAKLFWA